MVTQDPEETQGPNTDNSSFDKGAEAVSGLASSSDFSPDSEAVTPNHRDEASAVVMPKVLYKGQLDYSSMATKNGSNTFRDSIYPWDPNPAKPRLSKVLPVYDEIQEDVFPHLPRIPVVGNKKQSRFEPFFQGMI